LLCGLALLPLPAEAQGAEPAESFIESSIAQGNAILTNPSLDASTRDREFRNFLLSVTDMNRVALFTLGSYANTTPPPVLAGFVSAFTTFDTALYEGGFGSYGKSLKVTGAAARSADDVIVYAEAPDPMGKPEPMQIAFRVRKNDAGHDIILDVALQGVWIAVSQQQGFSSFLQLHGGDVAMLSHELETRTAK
jgi:ABC-type transporter MlaC component